ncbi:MAG: FAD-binding oxidoreductase [Zetaproteobacteria bacterium]|nr:MAG: FAD-binding oxidoreductase [Zetaproteobacteria bacterium]
MLSAVLGRPVLHLAGTAWRDAPPGQFAVPAGHADDVSHLNLTPVAEVWMIPETAEEAEGQLRELLQRARETGRRVSVAGARHSMGGHTLYPDGIVVDMRPFRAMRVDPESRRLTVGAGAIWTDVLRHLDDAGLSVEVMQSDSAFTVGGSLSVNCHGWQFGRPPIASTVDSFRLMLADGSVVRCSRTENSELFSLTLGGYGLFGIILEADLRVVPNVRLRLQQEQVATTTASALLDRLRQEPHPALVYARLNVTTDRRFGQVRVSAYYPDTNGTVPALREPGMPGLSRAVFRGSAGSDLRTFGGASSRRPVNRPRWFGRRGRAQAMQRQFVGVRWRCELNLEQRHPPTVTARGEDEVVPDHRCVGDASASASFIPPQDPSIVRGNAHRTGVQEHHVMPDAAGGGEHGRPVGPRLASRHAGLPDQLPGPLVQCHDGRPRATRRTDQVVAVHERIIVEAPEARREGGATRPASGSIPRLSPIGPWFRGVARGVGAFR